MNRLSLLTREEAHQATKGDIVVDADSRSLYIKINDGDCHCDPPSAYSCSTFNCCWLSLNHLDMLVQLEQRIKTGGIPLREHPDIMQIYDRVYTAEITQRNQQARHDEMYDEMCDLRLRIKQNEEALTALQPSKVAVIEEGERKLQLQQQQQ